VVTTATISGMPQASDDPPKVVRPGGPREAGGEDAASLEEERKQIEADELASFERRAEWWRLHYGEADADIAERLRKAREHAEQMPPPDHERGSSD
jgi:hypothetical protein